MNFASKFVNLDYDSNEDGVELSDSEMQQGFDTLDFDEADDTESDQGSSSSPVAAAASSASSSAAGKLQSIPEKGPAVVAGPPPLEPAESSSSSKHQYLLERRRQRQEFRLSKSLTPSVSVGGKSKHRVNTNVVSVGFGGLANAADHLQTGDPVVCSQEGCGCIFSAVSKLREPKPQSGDNQMGDEDEDEDELKLEDGQRIWDCEFCGKTNVVDIEDEEIPKGVSQDYLVEAGPQTKLEAEDARLIIFCIDTSSSMAMGESVPGKIKLKGDHHSRQAYLDLYSQRSLPGHTFVTRLQAVQAAVDDQLKRFAKKCPNYRVALVAFNGAVTIYGDGNMEPKKVWSDDDLYDYAKLRAIGRECVINAPISESHEKLSAAVFDLKHAGMTSLGPALTIAISMASAQRGSKVVMCTDGMASKGLGRLIFLKSEETLEAAEKWYQKSADQAIHAGVTVDVISISQDQCMLEVVGGMANQTKGSVDKINIPDVAENFEGILQNPVVATNVNAKMFVHKGLRLRNEHEDLSGGVEPKAPPTRSRKALRVNGGLVGPSKSPNPNDSGSKPAVPNSATSSKKDKNNKRKRNSAKKSADAKNNGGSRFIVDRIARDIGNVTAETEVFFEFSVRKIHSKQWKKLKGLPFQVQIEYTRLDGSRCIRVITQMKEVTLKKAIAEKHADVSVIAAHGARKSASYAQMGDYESSRRVNFGHALYMDSISTRGEQQEVISRYVSAVRHWDQSVSDELDTEATESPHIARSTQVRRKSQRSRRRNDSMSNSMYAMSSVSTSNFSSPASRSLSKIVSSLSSGGTSVSRRTQSSYPKLSNAPYRANTIAASPFRNNAVRADPSGESTWERLDRQQGAQSSTVRPKNAKPYQDGGANAAKTRYKSVFDEIAAPPSLFRSPSNAQGLADTQSAAAPNLPNVQNRNPGPAVVANAQPSAVVGSSSSSAASNNAQRGIGMSRFGPAFRANMARKAEVAQNNPAGSKRSQPIDITGESESKAQDWWRMPREPQQANKKKKTKPNLVIDLSETEDSSDLAPATTPVAIAEIGPSASGFASSSAASSQSQQQQNQPTKNPQRGNLLGAPASGAGAGPSRPAPNSLSPSERRRYVPPADSAAYAAAKAQRKAAAAEQQNKAQKAANAAQQAEAAMRSQIQHAHAQAQMQAQAQAQMQAQARAQMEALARAQLQQSMHNAAVVAASINAQVSQGGVAPTQPPMNPAVFGQQQGRVQNEALPNAAIGAQQPRSYHPQDIRSLSGQPPRGMAPGARGQGSSMLFQQSLPNVNPYSQQQGKLQQNPAPKNGKNPLSPYGPPAVPLSSKQKQFPPQNQGWFPGQQQSARSGAQSNQRKSFRGVVYESPFHGQGVSQPGNGTFQQQNQRFVPQNAPVSKPPMGAQMGQQPQSAMLYNGDPRGLGDSAGMRQ